MAVETISALTALVIAVSVVLTAVFNARKGAEEVLRTLVEKQGARIQELEKKLEERDAKIDELEKRVSELSTELQKITHPKMKVGRMRKKQ